MVSEKARWVTTIGLVLGLVGVVMIFIWGPPQPSFGGDAILLESTNENKLAAEKAKYEYLSRIGLSLIGVSFALQLWGIWL